MASATIPEFAGATVRRSVRAEALVDAPAGALYEGGAHTRRTVGWRAPTAAANQAILGSLTTLRDRSRAATRNDGYAKSIIDKLVSNVVGTGIQPLSQAPDKNFRTAIQAKWLQWTDESDADGLLDFYGQQSQAVRTWFEGGETFVRLRPRLPGDGLSVPLQLQVLEPELCPHTHTLTTRRIRAGIEFNGIGRRVAYHFHPSRPETDDYDRSQLRAVPAHNVVHLFDPLRPGQLRGLPVLTPALVSLYELDKFDDAALVRQQLANMFVAFLKRAPGASLLETTEPFTGEEREHSPEDMTKPMVQLAPGAFAELEPGEEVQFSKPPGTEGYEEFMRQQLYGSAAAAGVPYELVTGDMSRVNDRTVRVILNEFRRRIQAWQHQVVVFQLCRAVWRAWMDRVFLTQAVPIPMAYLDDPTPWLAVKWVPQGWPYLHPLQDVQASKEAIRSGLTSRQAEVSARGEDAEVIDAEQKADNDRADQLGLRYDSDGRVEKTPAAVPTPEPAENKTERKDAA